MKYDILRANIHQIEQHIQEISQEWASTQELVEIFKKHSMDISFARTEYFVPVLEYFVSVVKSDAPAGRCPIISKLLFHLADYNITASELFSICTNGKFSTLKIMSKSVVLNKELYEQTYHLFDKNFKGVLDEYLELINEKKRYISSLLDTPRDTQIVLDEDEFILYYSSESLRIFKNLKIGLTLSQFLEEEEEEEEEEVKKLKDYLLQEKDLIHTLL